MTTSGGHASYVEEAWVRSAIDGRSDFHVPVVIAIDGPFDEAACRGAVQALTERHEAFRTAFDASGDPVRRIVLERHAPELPMLDLSEGDDPETDAERFVLSLAARFLDLSAPPLWRAFLLRLNGGRHWVAFVFHHVVCDGWSGGVLVRDFAKLYRALIHGRSAQLSKLTAQPSDVAAGDRASVLSDEWAAYWRGQLPGDPQALPMGNADTPGVMIGRPVPTMDADHVAAVVRVAEEVNAGTASALYACALAALRPYLHGEAIVGVMTAGRDRGTRALVGVFADHVLFRCNLDDNPTFPDLVARVHHGVEQAKRHAAPLALIRDALGPDAKLPQSDMDVSLNYIPTVERKPHRVSESPVVTVAPVPTATHAIWPVGRYGCPGIVPLAYMLRSTPDGAQAEVRGCAQSWGESSVAVVERLGRELAATVAWIGEDPHARIGDLPES